MSRLRCAFHLHSCLMIIRLERVWRLASPLRASRPWRAAPHGCDLIELTISLGKNEGADVVIHEDVTGT